MALYNSFTLFSFIQKPSVVSSSSSPYRSSQHSIIVEFQHSSSQTRRTANYQKSIWDNSYMQSLPIDFMAKKYIDQREKLKEKVKHLIDHQHGLIEQLELVDTLRQLGLDYHFDLEIKDLLSSICSSTKNISNFIENSNLYGFALLFRLLREHGLHNASILRVDALISCFKKLKESFNSNDDQDVKGMLSFYEASYLIVDGEEELDETGKIAMEHLRYLDRSLLSPQLVEQINHSLEVPLHWRMLRQHAKWYIDVYEKQENANPILLELAKLDFNMVQSIHKTEVQELSRWWQNLDLVQNEHNFTRDRLVENYLLGVGVTFPPQFSRFRKEITKICNFVAVIDDIYDVYGTLDELKLFTNAIEEWKIDADQQLPNYMKMCLIALFNTMNDFATSFSMEKDLDILPFLKQVWADLCKAYLIEARWYYSGYTPTLNEYLENAWISIGGNCVFIPLYCLSDDLTIDDLNSLEFYPSIIRHTCMLFRLFDDLGTSTDEMQRGDVSKSIQCYMKEKNVSELIARDHIKCLIRNSWKDLNQELATFSKFTKPFREVLVSTPRIAQFFYQYEDGYGGSYSKTKDEIISVLFKPILL